MLLDLHNHTRYSPDSRVAPAELVALATRIGIQGIAITDHNAVAGIAEAAAAASKDFLVVPGIEVSTATGHVLGYGVREVVPRDLGIAETVERITALGGVAVAAHPFRFWSGLGKNGLDAARFPAYETANARTLRRGNVRARETATSRKVGETGGSDSHFLDEVARAVTAVEAGVASVDDLLQALARGKTRSQGFDRDVGGTLRYVPKAVGEWIGRGMKRI
ncbi:MAG TPA: PHP domain-containing protein [Thermoplasmata archaeon]|nr:PHP domain-containing protein [Thermoplasmata archaeon]